MNPRLACLALLFLLSCPRAPSQDTTCGITWGPIIQLSANVDSLASTGVPRLVAWGNEVHCTWDGAQRVPYARSTSDGIDWEPVRDIVSDSLTAPFPTGRKEIMVEEGRVLVVFCGGLPLGESPLRYIFSTNGGAAWTDPITMIPWDTTGWIDGAAIRGDTMAVLYRRWNNGLRPGIIRTTNGGVDWVITDHIYSTGSLAFIPGYFFYAHPGGPGPVVEVVIDRSTDVGLTWLDETIISPIDGRGSDLTHLAAWTDSTGGSTVAAVWRDGGLGGGGWGAATAFSLTTDNGATWLWPPRALTIQHNGYFPKVAVRGNLIAVAWIAILSNTEHVNVRWSSDRGLTWSTVCDIAPNALVAIDPWIALTETAIHVAWEEKRGSLWNIFYRRGALPAASVSGGDPPLPQALRLHQNYPNPFNPATTIRYELPGSGLVTLSVHDVLGREVEHLEEGYRSAGTHEVVWKPGSVSSGVYLCRLTFQTGQRRYAQTTKIMVIR